MMKNDEYWVRRVCGFGTQAIWAVGSILAPYDSDQNFAVSGTKRGGWNLFPPRSFIRQHVGNCSCLGNTHHSCSCLGNILLTHPCEDCSGKTRYRCGHRLRVVCKQCGLGLHVILALMARLVLLELLVLLVLSPAHYRQM